MVALGVEWEWAPGILHRDENSLKLIDAAAASLGKVTKSDLNCTSEVAGVSFFVCVANVQSMNFATLITLGCTLRWH